MTDLVVRKMAFQFDASARHVGASAATVAKAFDQHVPLDERSACAQRVMSSALRREFGYRLRTTPTG